MGYNIIGRMEAINILNDSIKVHQRRGCPKIANLQRIIDVLNRCKQVVEKDC